jgi:hypothetical protein
MLDRQTDDLAAQVRIFEAAPIDMMARLGAKIPGATERLNAMSSFRLVARPSL